ncbi:MAG: MYXO-CTERM sorting domain-containing protein [Polyangiaceae bacterium]
MSGWQRKGWTSLAAVSAGVFLVSSVSARTLTLRAPSKALSSECDANTNFSFHDGPWYDAARTALANGSNFGASGVVKHDFKYNPPFDDFDPKKLDGADILLLNPVNIPVSREKFKPFRVYTLGGVGFISFLNAAYTFMADPGPCIGENTASVLAPSSPPMNGPFGAVGGTYTTGWNCSFINIESGVTNLSQNSQGPNGLMFDLSTLSPGAARAVSFADEELWAGAFSQSGCGAAFVHTSAANMKLLLNTFAWVLETAYDPIPDAVEPTGDTDSDGTPDVLDGDNDGDGILDLFEAGDHDVSTPPVDTDKDGTPDYLDTDSDNDGADDDLENQAGILDEPTDTDKDGTPDFQDTDSDDDGVNDDKDNCRTTKNPNQEDVDQDKIGDACDSLITAPDGGAGTDAGWGGSGPVDAGLGGNGASAGVAGNVPGGGTSTGSDDGGCGCRVGSAQDHAAWLLLLALAGLVRARRRR